MKVIVLDVETTGLPEGRNISPRDTHKWPYVIQLSWLVFDVGKNKLVKCEDHIVALPKGYVVPSGSTLIHGITTERMREEGVDIKPLLAQFRADLKQCHTLIAHNIEFDKNMIEVEFYRNGFKHGIANTRKIEFCTMLHGKTICNIEMIHPYTGKKVLKFPKLLELHDTLFHSQPKNLHNSLVDIMVCFRCFYKMCWGTDVIEVNTSFSDLWKQHC